MRVRKFTNSELQQYQSCRRSWYIKHFLGYGPKRDDGEVTVSRTGTLYHRGVEAYYLGAEPEEAIALVGELVAQTIEKLTADGRDTKKVKSNGELVRIMLEGYFDWLAETGADADLTVVGAEEQIEAPLAAEYFSSSFGAQVSLLGKVDLLATRRSTGRRVIVDDKTVQGQRDQEVLAPLAPQFKHYALIELLRNGEMVDGAIVRWARRVKRTARSTPPFYGEIPVEFTREILRSYYRHVMALVEEILTVERKLLAGMDPIDLGLGPTVGKPCGYCVFRPVCPVFDDATMNARDLLAWSYEKVDPLERYAEQPSAEEEDD